MLLGKEATVVDPTHSLAMPTSNPSMIASKDHRPPNELDLEVQFVRVERQNATKPASCTATARSHVMKRFHRRKQLDLSQRLENFRYVTEQVQKKGKRSAVTTKECAVSNPKDEISISKLDHFECLVADISELPVLLGHREFTPTLDIFHSDLEPKAWLVYMPEFTRQAFLSCSGFKLTGHALARQAGEPVINFNADTAYQTLHIVYRSSIVDPPLLNAMLLTLNFAIYGDPTSTKFLTYKAEALR